MPRQLLTKRLLPAAQVLVSVIISVNIAAQSGYPARFCPPAQSACAEHSGKSFIIQLAGVAVTQQLLDLCRLVPLGVGKHNIDLDFTIIQKKELNIHGSRNALTRDFEELIDTVKAQNLKLDDVVTNVYDFENAVQAFEDFSANANNMLKVMIKF